MATIIDADGHILEPRSVWQEYTEPAYRDRVIQIVRDTDGIDKLKIDGEIRGDRNMAIAAACTPGGLSDPRRARTMSWDEIVPGGYDPHVRVKDMDTEGIEVAFFYPSLWLIYGDLNDPQLAAAACRAYNNWIADFCKPYPDRFFGVAPLPLQDVDEAVREMRRVVKELGMRAVFIRPNPFNGRRLCDPAYDVFWREAQELNVPVAVHGSFGTKMQTLGQERYKDPFFFHMVCHPWEQQAACLDIICGGVLSKFPRLKVAFLESGVGWIGYWLDRMDGHFEKMGHYVPWLKKRPSELFREQCFISMDPDEHTLQVVADMGLEDCVIWGSDYPHFDCTFPGVVDEVKAACAALPERARRKIIGENAKRLYNL
ncbi:MAG: amidohydrolase family protein [Thermodesulfobacteriota bacterium]|jgi:predicted TIM-barrel fold metal-dependent hydrolase